MLLSLTSIFNNSNSMSHEFYQIMVGAHSMTIHSWKQLALWSLEYSCLKEEEKEKGKDIFLRSWKLFCEDIVSQYGGLGRFGKDEARYSFEIDIEKAKKAYGSLVTGI
jgi:adenosine deaminase CECR1